MNLFTFAILRHTFVNWKQETSNHFDKRCLLLCFH